VVERILGNMDRKIFIDRDIAKNALPLLPLGGGNLLGGGAK
jgi:hypothetical protein